MGDYLKKQYEKRDLTKVLAKVHDQNNKKLLKRTLDYLDSLGYIEFKDLYNAVKCIGLERDYEDIMPKTCQLFRKIIDNTDDLLEPEECMNLYDIFVSFIKNEEY